MALTSWIIALAAATGVQDKPAPKPTVEQLVERVRPSLVVVHHTGREGKRTGLGAGFVISKDGLIATNLHVIGDARPISVQFADGSQHEVVSVHASDRGNDLAIIKIKADKLQPLPLGDADDLKPGQAIVAMGHPAGLEHSVVAGVLSGKRDIEGMSMLQVAIPIEQGNSGGPVLDMQGRVVGIVTMKSLVTANLGFAVPVNALRPLIERPNPVPMEKWLTIGVLDGDDWQTLYGGRWRQRAGRIIAAGEGTGFGGRTLCLWQRPVPELPFHLSVNVKLEDEAGAAGLIFGGDDRDKHFGFYASAGKLRLTRFNGPDVFSWKIIHDAPSPHYRPGAWNNLRVHLEKERLRCYVNEQLVIEWTNPAFAGQRVGLAKFREPAAEFKNFRVSSTFTAQTPDAALRQTLERVIAKLDGEASAADLETLAKAPAASMRQLRDEALQLEKRVAQLRALAQTVHHQHTLAEIQAAVAGDEAKIDLVRAALLIAKLDNEELDVAAYVDEVDRLARGAAALTAKDADAAQKLAALNRFLFEERGFHGSRGDYYARSNSYLNEVIDDREGIPITLAVLYMELARRLGLEVVGVGLPGHFVVRHEPPGGKPQLLDVYENAKPLSTAEAVARVRRSTGDENAEVDLKAAGKKAILLRMLTNLMNIAGRDKDRPGTLRYLDAILVIDPEAIEERWVRAVLRWQSGQLAGALADCDWILARNPPDADLGRVRELRRLIERQQR